MLFYSSCGTSQGALYSWYDYENMAYQYIKAPTTKTTQDLLETYKKIIDKQTGVRKTVPPGIYAEYGYLLIKQNRVEEGVSYLEKEVTLYPESKMFIERIVKQFKK